MKNRRVVLSGAQPTGLFVAGEGDKVSFTFEIKDFSLHRGAALEMGSSFARPLALRARINEDLSGPPAVQ